MDTNILRKDHPESSAPTDETLETHYAALERAACPFCFEGWVFLGFEGEDENGEEIERVPCRRCHAVAQEVLYEEQRRSATVIDGVCVLKRLRQ